MKQTFPTQQNVEQTVKKLEQLMPEFGFGLQYIHNPKEKVAAKGFDLKNEVRILDICNPKIAYEILSQDMSIASVMPCKIAVYEESGQTYVALNSFVQQIDDLNPDLVDLAQEAQEGMIKLIEASI